MQRSVAKRFIKATLASVRDLDIAPVFGRSFRPARGLEERLARAQRNAAS